MTYHNAKMKHSCLSPEEVDPEKVYSFTFNPQDKYQYWDFPDPRMRFRKAYGAVREVFSYFNKFYYTEGSLEVSKAGRVHYHGILKVKDVFSFYMTVVHHLMKYGTYEIDTISDPVVWDAYVNKQKYIPSDVIFRLNNEMNTQELTVLQDHNFKKGDVQGLEEFGFNIANEQYLQQPEQKIRCEPELIPTQKELAIKQRLVKYLAVTEKLPLERKRKKKVQAVVKEMK